MWDGTDRRKFVRAEYPCLITLRKGGPHPQAVLSHTEDISLLGARVRIGKKVEVMGEVDLEIDLKDAQAPIALKGTISRVKEIPAAQPGKPPRYDVGIQFIFLKEEDKARVENVIKHLKSIR